MTTLPPSPASAYTSFPPFFTMIQIHRYHLTSWLLSSYTPTAPHCRHSRLHDQTTILILHPPHTSHPGHHETPNTPYLNKPFHNLPDKLPPKYSHSHLSINIARSLIPLIPITTSQIPTFDNIQPTLIYTNLLPLYHPRDAHTYSRSKATYFLSTTS
jgi:hypothetical protein